jgi:hypothetical protein
MMTVRQIERLWGSRSYDRLFHELLTARPEAALRLGVDTTRPVCAAALGVIRLDELSQGHAPISATLIRTIIAAQQEDGGWGDLITSTLCLRALLTDSGNGAVVQHGLEYMANLQKPEGIWPNIPIRRMPADPYISALILYELAGQPGVSTVVRLDDAVEWFESNQSILDVETRHLWSRAKLKCRSAANLATRSIVSLANGVVHQAQVMIWS